MDHILNMHVLGKGRKFCQKLKWSFVSAMSYHQSSHFKWTTCCKRYMQESMIRKIRLLFFPVISIFMRGELGNISMDDALIWKVNNIKYFASYFPWETNLLNLNLGNKLMNRKNICLVYPLLKGCHVSCKVKMLIYDTMLYQNFIYNSETWALPCKWKVKYQIQ